MITIAHPEQSSGELKNKYAAMKPCSLSITIHQKTCLYNFDPLKPHFYTVKLGFTGGYIIFLISAQNIDCGYLLELPRRGSSNKYPQSMFLSRYMKQEAHGPQLAHLSETATADMQMACNIFPILL